MAQYLSKMVQIDLKKSKLVKKSDCWFKEATLQNNKKNQDRSKLIETNKNN